MTVLPDRIESDAAWERVLAARARGETGHREIAAYIALHGLRVLATAAAHDTAEAIGTANGYPHWGALDNYTGAYLVPTVTGGAQIIAGPLDDPDTVTDRWTYTDLDAALEAWLAWSFDIDNGQPAQEPHGWIRHQPSDRRRHYAADGITYWEEVRP